MARGTAFSQLVYMLRAEIRRSTSTAVGVDDLPDLKQAINRQYKIQRARREWQFLNYFFNMPLNAGQQFYGMPSLTTAPIAVTYTGDGPPYGDGGLTPVNNGYGLSYDPGTGNQVIYQPPPMPAPPSSPVTMDANYVKRVAVYFSGIPQPLERGITFEDYALFDYQQSGAASDPVLKWDIRAGTASEPQIEVWPVPSSNTSYLKWLAGVRTPTLVNDTDLCWLDDMLVVLYASADCLALDMSEPRIGLPPAAQLKLKVAEDYYNSLVANDQGVGRQTFGLGQGMPKRGVDTNSLVRVRG